jgi:hypothetical protein
MLSILFQLLCYHALADFALQSDAMAKGKNRHRKPEFIPEGQKYTPCWFYWLTAHALIHGLFVGFLFGSPLAGFVMSLLHWGIDFIKCENLTNPHIDQLLHFICICGFVWYYF